MDFTCFAAKPIASDIASPASAADCGTAGMALTTVCSASTVLSAAFKSGMNSIPERPKTFIASWARSDASGILPSSAIVW